MEIIKTGDVPALISNVEVMKLIQKNIESHNKQEEQDAEMEDTTIGAKEEYMSAKIWQKQELKQKGRNKLKQKKWMEEQVLEYIEETPCTNVDFDALPNMVKRLRAPKPKKKNIEKDKSSLSSSSADMTKIKDDEDNFGLTDAETLQILNLMPQELVEYHLIIEDISSRMSDDRQNELIEIVKQYVAVVKDEEQPNNNNNDAMEDALTEEDDHVVQDEETMKAEAIFSAQPVAAVVVLNGENGNTNTNTNANDDHNYNTANKISNGDSSLYIKKEPGLNNTAHMRVKTEPVS